MCRLLFTFGFILSSVLSFSQSEDSVFIRKIADEILVNGKAYSNLHELTKTVGGRLSGSPGMYKAEAWGMKTLKDMGADKVWLQECMVPHWVRGGKDEAKLILPGNKETPLDVIALGNSVGTGSKGVTARAILINNKAELEQRKDELKGKIVFYNYKFNPRFIQTFYSYGDAVIYRELGASWAAKYGALAMITRSMTHSVDNIPHTGSLDYIDSLAKIPAAAIGLWDADKLAKAISDNKEVKVFLRTNAKMLPDTLGHNVIGELTGSEFPGEYITVGGHLDSWDPAEGAHDDGAGCVHAIEVLRALKAIGYKPRHTIRVVLFANEENGLRGGTKYAEEAKAKNEKHIFGLESDAGGFTPRGFSIGLPEDKLEKIRKEWLPLLENYGVYQFVKGGGGADVGPLKELLGTPVSELIPDSQRYFDYHHTRNDVLANVNKRELELGCINMAALIYLVDKYGL
ncbi:MAG: M20/M25/M40 family metallo-hydrolase [Bacteroidetes bacterium]|nr:M20/M25/M40 family metallo-hydrolase [Bacteroidota bacterium]MBS1973729.1 M20/M25/M40 family metallo-hydrolase [Bacteroidota bacterium]